MLHPSTKKLIDRLAEMTELGKLDWAEGDDGAIVYSTEGYSVCLPSGSNEIVITSIDGKELERASAEELAITQAEHGGTYSDLVAAMTSEATRIARGTEAAISSLLAGMDETPPAAEPEPTVMTEDAPEDVADETEALASDEVDALAPEHPAEEVVNEEPETVAAPDLEPEIEPEPEPEPADAAFDAEVSTEDAGDAPAEAAEITATTEFEDSTEEDLVDASPEVSADDPELETESDVTEAVARLADEVNGREDTSLDTAAAAAVGTVALAAGMTDQDKTDIETETAMEDAQTEPQDSPTIETAAVAEPESSFSYVPFGLEQEDTEAVATEAEIAPTPAVNDDEAVRFEQTPAEEESDSVTLSSDVEQTGFAEPETAELQPEPEAVIEEEAPMVASAPEEFEAPEPASFDTPVEIESTEIADTPSPEQAVPEEPAPLAATAPESTDPVSEPQQVYSLSGIGAGFGLGALAAKTEASGIPGSTSPAEPAPERIVIDATDDVLPEPEGMDGFRPDHPAAAGLKFGNTETPAQSPDAEAESEDESDILKPRTRFNPWD